MYLMEEEDNSFEKIYQVGNFEQEAEKLRYLIGVFLGIEMEQEQNYLNKKVVLVWREMVLQGQDS